MKTTISAPPPAPAPVDAGQASINYVRGMADPALQQLLLESEQTYRPQYTALNLQDINQYLMGVGTQGQEGYTPGVLSQLGSVSPQISQIQATANTQQRAADIADVANLGSQASQAFRSSNPELYSQLASAQQLGAPTNYFSGLQGAISGPINQGLQQQGMAALAQGGNLSPAEIRQIQQGVREAYASRGTEMGSGAVTAEAVAQQQAGRQRQLENLQLASGIGQQQISNLGLLGQMQQGQGAADRAYALQLAGAYGSSSFDPMMAILGRQSTAPQMSSQQQGYASNLMGNLQGPQLFDPNAGVNLALQNSSNLGNYQAATYGARANAQGQIAGGLMSGLGSLGGSIFGAAGAAGGFGQLFK
jgi:hypothetical protein